MSSAKTNIRVQVAVATMADATWRARLEGQRVDAAVARAGRVLRAAAVPGVVRRRGSGQTPFYEGIALKGGHV